MSCYDFIKIQGFILNMSMFCGNQTLKMFSLSLSYTNNKIIKKPSYKLKQTIIGQERRLLITTNVLFIHTHTNNTHSYTLSEYFHEFFIVHRIRTAV